MAIDGKWNLTVNTPMGAQTSTLEVTSSGSSLTGTQAGAQGGQAINNGAVNGDEATWSIDITSPMPMTLSYKAVVEGDGMTGSVQLGSFGSAPLKGVRA